MQDLTKNEKVKRRLISDPPVGDSHNRQAAAEEDLLRCDVIFTLPTSLTFSGLNDRKNKLAPSEAKFRKLGTAMMTAKIEIR